MLYVYEIDGVESLQQRRIKFEKYGILNYDYSYKLPQIKRK